jgi:hypothetical protein
MPSTVDPENLRVTDDLYAAGRARIRSRRIRAGRTRGRGPATSGRAWFAGWLDGLATAWTAVKRAVRAYPHLLADDRADCSEAGAAFHGGAVRCFK